MTPFAFPSLNDQITEIRRNIPKFAWFYTFPYFQYRHNYKPFWPHWAVFLHLGKFGHFGPMWTLWASLGHFEPFLPFWSLGAILRNLHFHLMYHLFGIVVFRMTNDQVLIKVKHHLKGSGFTKDCFMVLSQKQSKVTIWNKGIIVVASRNMKQDIIGPSNVDFVISFLSWQIFCKISNRLR